MGRNQFPWSRARGEREVVGGYYESKQKIRRVVCSEARWEGKGIWGEARLDRTLGL